MAERIRGERSNNERRMPDIPEEVEAAAYADSMDDIRNRAKNVSNEDDHADDAPAVDKEKQDDDEAEKESKTSLGHKIGVGVGVTAAIAVGATMAAAVKTRHDMTKITDGAVAAAVNMLDLKTSPHGPRMPSITELRGKDKGSNGPEY